MVMEVVGGSDPGKATINEKASGQIDMTSKAMSMTMDMSADMPESGNQSYTIEMYMADGYIYMKMPSAVGTEQWIKMKLDDSLWNQQNQFDQQMNFLKSASNMTKLAG